MLMFFLNTVQYGKCGFLEPNQAQTCATVRFYGKIQYFHFHGQCQVSSMLLIKQTYIATTGNYSCQ